MRPVRREELLDLATYERSRGEIRPRIIAAKAERRVHVAGALTLLFENTATVRYQIQEMLRAERIVREAEVRHEIETYNELLGGRGELGFCLLVEITDPAERDRRLREWLDLPRHVYARLPDGEKVYAKFDPRQVGEDQLSAVQYMKLDVRGVTPVAVGCDLPALRGETPLTEEQREALRADLAAE